jgi:type I restriction enzyme, S subunit
MVIEFNEMILSDAILINPVRKAEKTSLNPFIAMADLEIDYRYVEPPILKRTNTGSKFQNGDTLLARITPSLENGKTAYVESLEDNQVGVGSTEFIVLSGKPNVTTNLFVYYIARTPMFRNTAIQFMTGTSGRQRVQESVFDNFKIQIPNICIQSRIVDILGKFDDKIKLLKESNIVLEKIIESYFKSWFITFDEYKEFDDSKIGQIPKGWNIVPLDKIAEFLNGLPLQKFRPIDNSFLPVIKIREMKNGFSEDVEEARSDLEKKYVVNNGDILFSWSGTLELMIWSFDDGALNQHIFKVTSDEYEKWFYYVWINFHLDDFRRIAEDKATTMGHIQRQHLSDAQTLIPPPKVLEKMNDIMIPIFGKLIQNKISIQNLTKTRDVLLPKLMSGKISVTSIE